MIKVAKRFEIITEALAAVDEQGQVPLEPLAHKHGLALDELKELLEPAIYCDFRDGSDSVVNRSDVFLVTEDDHLTASKDHWLRDLDSRVPAPQDATRLLITAMLAQGMLGFQDPALDGAVAKLRDAVGAELVVDIVPPRFLALCERARDECRALDLHYFPEVDGRVRERRVEPAYVGSKWRNWYMVARTCGTQDVRTYRIDRILSASLLDARFEPFDADLPDWFDLEDHKRRIRLRMARADLRRIPPPGQVDEVTDLDDGRVEAAVTLIGQHRVSDLLLLLGADAEIVDDPALAAQRAQHAAEVLARYERSP